jgi:DNA gyrase subunit A
MIAAARVVQEADDLTLISANGVVLRTKVKDISQSGRATRGVTIMNMQEGDSVASLARIADADLRRVGASESPAASENG